MHTVVSAARSNFLETMSDVAFSGEDLRENQDELTMNLIENQDELLMQ